MENGDMEFATEVKKEDQVSSHQRVGAIRDFPHLCGRNARMKVEFYARLDRSKTAVKTKHVLNHSEHVQLKKKSNSDDMAELVRRENNSLDPNKKSNNFQSVPKSHGVNVPPLGHENDPMARNKVRNALRLFQAVSRNLLQEAKAKSNEKERMRFDLQAAKILKEKGNYVNVGDKILGSVPGIEVGDKFQYRIELNIIGLHRQIQGGIDYVKIYVYEL
ncbi:[histone H3]-lysine(4) N-trimethyltransferase [Trifolium repens]|nr:[histone H3]-lysine(4) N-trimethyltransferase [Trifolium repens]